MPIFMHKKIYLGGMAFAVPPKYIIEPFFCLDMDGGAFYNESIGLG